MSFASLNLVPELLRAVEESGYTEPTPIQAQAIPVILARLDIMGCAQTGTGKTASFTLPMLNLLAPQASTSTSPARHPVRALVLTPTRELAAQVEESVRTYGKYLPLRAAVVYGGIDIKPQIKALQAGVEIVVATPGRLLDHVESKSINLSQVQILVLDEADRMLDMGFMPAINRILALLPPGRQNLLFSATFSEDIKRLANQFMRNPTMIEVARRNAPAELVTHQAYEVPAERKYALLAHLIRSRDMQQVLIFTRRKIDADQLARKLARDGFAATAIHSDRSQLERTQALDEFKQGKVKILVATEVAARGLDIDQLPFVINYELPNTPEDYVHRIGRTGRAGTPGEAISLVSPDEMEYLANIEKLLKRQIPRLVAPEFEGTSERKGDKDFRAHRASKALSAPTDSGHGRPNSDGASRHVGKQDADGNREPRRPSPRDREDRDSGRTRTPTQYTPQSVPPPPPGHFDFTKPYESSAKTAANNIPVSKPAVLHRGKAVRPTAALLRARTPETTEE